MSGPDRSFDRESLRGRLILMLAAIVAASVIAVGISAVSAFDRAVAPELANRTRLIGTIVRAELQRALELGIPIDAVAGLDAYLKGTLAKFSEVDRITITNVAGRPLASVERAEAESPIPQTGIGSVVSAERADFVLPILEGNNLVGAITVTISPHFVRTRLREVFLDVMVLALIATLVALELALAVTIGSVGKPLDRVLFLLRDQSAGNFLHRIRPGGLSGLSRTSARLNDHAEDLAARMASLPQATRARIEARIAEGLPLRLRLSDFNDIRLALFLFSVATEIASAFMPLYALGADRPVWLSPELAAAAPLVFYLAAIGAVSPFGSALVARFGARQLFLVAVPCAGLSLVGLGLSTGIIAISLWQGAMAVFYAVATVACQEYAIRAAGDRDSAKAVGGFLMVIYGGLFCGSALGGLIAGRFGFAAAFLAGAVLAVLSVILGAASMRGRAGDRVAASEAAEAPRAWSRRWLTPRYIALLLGVSVPMNATMVVFTWYLAPLMLADLGSGPAEIARVIMLGNLATLLLAPLSGRLTESRVGPFALIVIGAFGIAASLLSLGYWSGFWAIAVAVTGVGACQILVETPLYTLAFRITGGTGPGTDLLRVLERVGAIIGLAASAVLLGRIGAEGSLRLLGLAVLAGLLAYAIIDTGARARRGVSGGLP